TASPGWPEIPPFAYGLGSWTPVAGSWLLPPQALQAAGGAQTASPDLRVLSQADLDAVVHGALARLTAAGVSPALVSQLSTAQFRTGDLGGAYLGLAYPDRNQVVISADAAGWGWYVGLTDSAFTATSPGGPLEALPGTAAAGRMDLLTAVLHEMGHLAE